ncbi:MAG: ABC transporter substrate-binding protein [Massiliimalia sp.]|jgi:ABC-type glycerol-3-phosphate transport system substrate-binding protein
MKRTVSVLLSGLLLFSTASCGEKPKSEESKPESNITSQPESSELEAPKEPENPSDVIRLAYGYDGSPQTEMMKNWLEQSAQTWDYHGVTIELEQIPVDGFWGGAESIQDSKKEGTAPPDITISTSMGFSTLLYGNYGSLYQPIDHYLSEYPEWEDGSFYPAAQETVQHQGKTYGVPFSMRADGALWYRKDILEQAGVTEFAPKTWEEFLEVLKTIQTNCPDVRPIWYDNKADFFTSLLYANGGTWEDEKGKYLTGSKEMEQALNCYCDLQELGIQPSSTSDASTYSFEKGNLAFEQQFSEYYVRYFMEGTSEKPEYAENLDVMAIPPREGTEASYSCGISTECFMVSYESGNPRAAVDFIMHCMKPEYYSTAIRQSWSMSVCPEVTQSQEYQALGLKSKLTDIAAQGKTGMTMEPIKRYNCVKDMVERVVNDRMAPKDAMEQFEQDMKLYFTEDELTKEK